MVVSSILRTLISFKLYFEMHVTYIITLVRDPRSLTNQFYRSYDVLTWVNSTLAPPSLVPWPMPTFII